MRLEGGLQHGAQGAAAIAGPVASILSLALAPAAARIVQGDLMLHWAVPCPARSSRIDLIDIAPKMKIVSEELKKKRGEKINLFICYKRTREIFLQIQKMIITNINRYVLVVVVVVVVVAVVVKETKKMTEAEVDYFQYGRDFTLELPSLVYSREPSARLPTATFHEKEQYAITKLYIIKNYLK